MEFFIFNLDLSCSPIGVKIRLNFKPHAPQRMIDTLHGDIVPNKYIEGANLIKKIISPKTKRVRGGGRHLKQFKAEY